MLASDSIFPHTLDTSADSQAMSGYWKGLNGLFTRKAIQLYLPTLEMVQLKYFDAFIQTTRQNNGAATPFIPHFRELMCAVSCRTFVGKYMSEETIKSIANDFYYITTALELVNFPIIVPFTKTWYGERCADRILAEFCKCAAHAKVNIKAGKEPDCVMDRWISNMISSEDYRENFKTIAAYEQEKPDIMLRWFSDMEISKTILALLFASQDTSSSACTWLF